ncbi:hypothetical protein [Halapricum hydrolyticum]|uniref:Uncharacterized protein n=1 Tax=Halapricum hydrolyticum TaxID=2979991 RepID=A0AAE3LEI1_9EURY|nr:hypothetical protein [Halapricum hydrolyticum]MCU4717103.1 hypothetical protein [Halapricum hydrolyticum]MCU4726030.1 hypothetical protein [Halapricum hydrolyticum]
MTDGTDRWLLLVVALIGVALLVPAVSAHGTNETTDGWTDWVNTNVWGGDAPDDVGPYAPARDGHHGPHGGGHYGPADGSYAGDRNYANETRYGGQYGPHHGPHHSWAYGAGDERPANASYYHGGAYVNGSAHYHGAYANGTYYPGDGSENGTYYPNASTVNGTDYPSDGYGNSPLHSDEPRTDGTDDSEWRYRGGPGGCH